MALNIDRSPYCHHGRWLVRRRQWLSREKFLDLLGASNLIPGPSSSETGDPCWLLTGWMDRTACCGNLLHLEPCEDRDDDCKRLLEPNERKPCFLKSLIFVDRRIALILE